MSSYKVIECAKLISDRNLQIAFIESATAGRICSEFALSEFSGNILRGGLACYSVFVKKKLLNVPQQLIDDYTPESAEVTEALAQGGAELFNADITVAVTGLTCAGGSESNEKPVGTMFLHFIFRDQERAYREEFRGTASSIITQTIDRTAEIITKHLLEE